MPHQPSLSTLYTQKGTHCQYFIVSITFNETLVDCERSIQKEYMHALLKPIAKSSA